MSSVVATPAVRKSLRRQFSWTLPANLVYGVCNLLLLVVLNKLGNAAVAGDFTLALAITAPVYMCVNLRFSTVLGSDTRSTVHLGDYFKLRAYLVIAALALIVGILAFRDQAGIATLIVLVALTKSAEAFSDLCCGVQQRIERMDRIAISLTANGTAMTCAFATVFFLTSNLTLAVFSLLTARLAVLFCYDIPTARKSAHHEVFTGGWAQAEMAEPSRMRLLLWSTAPLGITAALISLTTNIPRYVIPVVFDREMLGLFASVAVTLQAGSLVFRAIELPAIPRLAKLVAERNRADFWKLQAKLAGVFVAFGCLACIASLLVGPQLLTLVYTDQYAALGGVLALMALSTSVGQIAGLVESSLIAARVIAVQVPMHCLTATTCLILCSTLIPKFGLYGAVLAVTICRIPFMLIGVLLLHQKLRQPPEPKLDKPLDVKQLGEKPADVARRKAA